MGRYITPDPIGLVGGINLFTYANSNPTNLIDPLGLLSLGEVINMASSIMVPAAREAGLITPKLAARFSLVGSVVGALVDPRSLSAKEGQYLHNLEVDYELRSYQKILDEINKQWDPMFKKFHVYDDVLEDKSACQ